MTLNDMEIIYMKYSEIIFAQAFALLGVVLACVIASVSQARPASNLLFNRIMANPAAINPASDELFNPDISVHNLEAPGLNYDFCSSLAHESRKVTVRLNTSLSSEPVSRQK